MKRFWSIQIMIGQRVRAYQYHFRKDCYVEGTLVQYVTRDEQLMFKIEVDKAVRNGQETEIKNRFYFTEANGTCYDNSNIISNRVEPLDHFDAWENWYNTRIRSSEELFGRETPMPRLVTWRVIED